MEYTSITQFDIDHPGIYDSDTTSQQYNTFKVTLDILKLTGRICWRFPCDTSRLINIYHKMKKGNIYRKFSLPKESILALSEKKTPLLNFAQYTYSHYIIIVIPLMIGYLVNSRVLKIWPQQNKIQQTMCIRSYVSTIFFWYWTMLTHFPLVPHIYVSELGQLGSDNGLSPVRRQTFI